MLSFLFSFLFLQVLLQMMVSCHAETPLFYSKFPPFLSFDRRNKTARAEISSLKGMESEILSTSSRHNCMLLVTTSQVAETSLNLAFSFKISCRLNSGKILGRETCLFSSVVADGALKLETLSGMASENSCPSARQLVQVHHEVARQIGATISCLDDHSRFRLFREEYGDNKRNMWIRTTLGRLLFYSPTIDTLTSYYSEFGYDFIFNDDRDRQAVKNAFDLVRNFKTSTLLSLLDVDWQPNTEVIQIISQHSHITSLVLLLRHLFQDPQQHHACTLITRLVSKIEMRAFHRNVSSFENAIYLVSKSRPMSAVIKQ